MVNILLIDDHPLIIEGIKTMLAGNNQMQVAETCYTATDAITFLANNNNNKPDIILLDISLPDMDGLELCSQIRSMGIPSKILGLTSANEFGIIAGLLQRGANGYLLKNIDHNELFEAIYTVLEGKVYISKDANAQLLEYFQNVQSAVQSVPSVTRREKEVIQLLAEGLNGPQIAEKLFLSPYTVETHRKNLFKKFNVNSLQMLLKVARDYHLIA
jgi:DNA-binding NarL/FixJ family response regulator